MPKITGFMLADDVVNTVAQNGQQITTLVNPQAVLRPQYIPGAFSFAFSINIRDVDPSTIKQLKLIIEDPNGAVVQNPLLLNMQEKPIPRDSSLPTNYVAFTANVSVRNLPFTENGIYKLITYLNDEQLDPQEIPVYVQTQTGNNLDDKKQHG